MFDITDPQDLAEVILAAIDDYNLPGSLAETDVDQWALNFANIMLEPE